MGVTARRDDYDSWTLCLPRARASRREPMRDATLPGRFGRRSEQQRRPAIRLKFELELHPRTLAEPTDKRCPMLDVAWLR